MKQCETPGHEERPGPYFVNGKRACRSCYNIARKGPDYVPKKPGRKPDPTKPGSRYNPSSRHYRGERDQCGGGHKWQEGKYVIRTDGKRVCLICIEDRKGEMCPAGLHPRSENENEYGQCRPCAAKRQTIHRLKAKYGLTVDQFEAKLAEQDNHCAICKRGFDFEHHNDVCVDHDHSCCSGQRTCGNCLREILCADCNRGLGAFHDNPVFLAAAIEYLQRHQSA